eukprot:m.74011 g.74011  ORF g.74011 m.74011 type:complete len:231 (-) comp7751_c0_seq1:211-903(-)
MDDAGAEDDNYVDINAQNNNGETPLMLALTGRNDDIALLFLNHGSDVNSPRNDGQYALDLALELSRDDVVAAILQRVDHLSPERGRRYIHTAIRAGRDPVVLRLLVQRGADPCSTMGGLGLLFTVASYRQAGWLEHAATLIELGTPPWQQNEAGLRWYETIADATARAQAMKLASLPWTPADHHLMSPQLQAAVEVFLLASNRLGAIGAAPLIDPAVITEALCGLRSVDF